MAALAALAIAQTPTGTVAGSLLDGQTGRPIVGGEVAIDGQSAGRILSDSDGRFRFTLSPGAYTLQITAANYFDVHLTDVQVRAGETADVSTVMSSRSLVTRVDVTEKANAVGATEVAMMQERKLSGVVTDGISHQELASGASSDAAGALEKVTGVSVVGEGFVYVRGLGERYSSTQLNGALIPTTEPEKRVVPLDLFPASLIENIRIVKTYSPDLPAEFSGGMVQMQTADFPTDKTFVVSYKNGFNSVSTFNRFLTYPGGGRDFFGFDETRAGEPFIAFDEDQK